jgi:hypothetical protein
VNNKKQHSSEQTICKSLFLAGEADAYHQSLRFAPPKVTRIATPKQGPFTPPGEHLVALGLAKMAKMVLLFETIFDFNGDSSDPRSAGIRARIPEFRL